MNFHIVKMCKDKLSTKMSKIFFINVWRKSVFDIYCTELGVALTTVLPVLFKYCYKYCYSYSRKLWAVMKAGDLACWSNHNQDHYYLIECNLFWPWYSWNIAHLALTNNRPPMHTIGVSYCYYLKTEWK
jgi:hypothetical protein